VLRVSLGAMLLLPLGAGDPSDPAVARPGPLLRTAAVALDAGAHETAARLYARVRRTYPIVADHAARWEAEALRRAGDFAAAADRARQARTSDPAGPLAGALARIEAEASRAAGDLARAREAWQAALRHEQDPDERAALLASIARALEAEGDRDAARGAWLEIWSELPQTDEAAAADEALGRLDAGDPPLRRSPERLHRRCDALTRARLNPEALETCAIARGIVRDPVLGRRLDRRRADLLFRLRRYPAAERAYAGLPGREARFWRARSLARSGRVEASIAAFESLARGRDVLAFRARFLAGTLWAEREPARAAAHYAAVASRAPAVSQRREAEWRLGWAAFRAGRFVEAERRLREMVADTPDPLDALRGRYWRARAAIAAGDTGGSAALAALAREFPMTYYGWRAARALGQEPGFGTTGPPPPPDATGPSQVPERTVARARILIEAGLAEDAARELAAEAERVRGRRGRLLLAGLLQDAGDFHRAQRLVVDAYLLDLARGPGSGGIDLWWAAWPTAFGPAVQRAVAGRAVDAPLLYAVMREESGYRPKVRSVVGARGLAQIMPETGRRLAAQLGEASFDPDELFVPDRNLQLAGLYLESLLARFDGRASAAIASYNAGPAAVSRWIAADPELPDDEWVEAIPYDQTRKYVKRVLRSRYAYEVLY